MLRVFRIFVVIAVLVLGFATPAAAADEVPIKGTVLGDHWIDPSAPGCEPGTADWEFYSSGTGQMSHLGRVEYFLRQCTVFNPEQGTAVSSGTIMFTAANNDTLVVAQEMNSQIIGDFAGFTLEATWTVVDGTGRFTHATGSGSMDGVGDIPGGDALFDLPDGAAQLNFVGKIAYDASDRSEK